jgi:hypothetical protein
MDKHAELNDQLFVFHPHCLSVFISSAQDPCHHICQSDLSDYVKHLRAKLQAINLRSSRVKKWLTDICFENRVYLALTAIS